MKVAVIGSGAREHALVWAFSQSRRIHGLICIPGNAGIEEIADIAAADPMDSASVIKALKSFQPDLIFIGAEGPLENGLADSLRSEGWKVVGPGKEQAKLESSKEFSKQFMVRHGIPTASAKILKNRQDLETYLKSFPSPWVLKKSGLAAGKGVLETQNYEEALSFGLEVLNNDVLVAEEFLSGFEVSVFALMDGKNYLILPACSDHKKAFEEDRGLNTGGMGAICPVPQLSHAQWEEILKKIVEPTMAGLIQDNTMYTGVLFFGLMVCSGGPKVLEYNVRLGDPETQALIPRIQNDFVDLMEAMVNGNLNAIQLEVDPRMSLSVVIASPGYPGPYTKNIPIRNLPSNRVGKFLLFHAGTHNDDEGKMVTTLGRCFSAVGIGEFFDDAQRRANNGAKEVDFEGAWFRRDIGKKMIELSPYSSR